MKGTTVFFALTGKGSKSKDGVLTVARAVLNLKLPEGVQLVACDEQDLTEYFTHCPKLDLAPLKS